MGCSVIQLLLGLELNARSRPEVLSRPMHTWGTSSSMLRSSPILKIFYVALNGLALVFKAESALGIGNRGGILATINLALLLYSSHLRAISNPRGESLKTQLGNRWWLLAATAVTGSIHVICFVCFTSTSRTCEATHVLSVCPR